MAPAQFKYAPTADTCSASELLCQPQGVICAPSSRLESWIVHSHLPYNALGCPRGARLPELAISAKLFGHTPPSMRFSRALITHLGSVLGGVGQGCDMLTP